MVRCIIIDDDIMSTEIVKSCIQRCGRLECLANFYNVESAKAYMQDHASEIEAIFLDIEMGTFTGFDFLRTTNTDAKVVIMSGRENYALKAFDYKVCDYLLKPFTYERFMNTVERIAPAATQATPEIFLKVGHDYVKVRYKDIYYIESQENYLLYVTREGKYMVLGSFKKLEEQLPSGMFMQIHRAVAVNREYMHSLQDGILSLVDKQEDKQFSLAVAKRYNPIVRKEIEKRRL